jgi:hypothetical protein
MNACNSVYGHIMLDLTLYDKAYLKKTHLVEISSFTKKKVEISSFTGVHYVINLLRRREN